MQNLDCRPVTVPPGDYVLANGCSLAERRGKSKFVCEPPTGRPGNSLRWAVCVDHYGACAILSAPVQPREHDLLMRTKQNISRKLLPSVRLYTMQPARTAHGFQYHWQSLSACTDAGVSPSRLEPAAPGPLPCAGPTAEGRCAGCTPGGSRRGRRWRSTQPRARAPDQPR